MTGVQTCALPISVVSRRGVALVHADGSAKVRACGKHAGTPCHKIIRHDVVMDAKKRLLAERGLTRWQDWNDADKPPAHEITHQACAQWLVASGHERGFAVDGASLSVEAYTQHRGKDAKLRFSSVDFAGDLTVFDPDKFAVALTQGIGHAKAFGCGLLLVRRVG